MRPVEKVSGPPRPQPDSGAGASPAQVDKGTGGLATDERVSTGISGLDSMLGGGLFRGRPYLLTGPTGSGKTLFGLEFLLEGVRIGEKVLLVAVDEPPYEILDNVRSFRWDLSHVHTLEANPGLVAFRRLGDLQEIKALQDVQSMQDYEAKSKKTSTGEDISLQSIYLKLRRQMDVIPFRRILIDSMTSIRHFALRSGVEIQTERVEIQSLLRFLSEKGTTTLITAQPRPADVLTPESVLCRGEIALTRDWAGHIMERWVWVKRMRGTAHDSRMRPFTITRDGITVNVGDDVTPVQ